ncbi:hypothetical protein [Micromonospora musae]|uniref:hypothetical protein n=1 Tax=Micromonospora musae TaxID=1894970 RepID=UPI0033F95A50
MSDHPTPSARARALVAGAYDVAAAATARIERESGLRARLAAGAHSYDLHGMRSEDESAG